ncbi:MAG: cation:proton antiporter [Prolixibacteraceae bacterium]|nr:cation:proton antiporter [Prolixibacteraceae bacterium]
MRTIIPPVEKLAGFLPKNSRNDKTLNVLVKVANFVRHIKTNAILHFLSLHIPFTEPVVIIALVLLILLIGPVFFERIRIPSIVGLLLSGAIIGPHGFNLLSPDLEFSLLGTIGLMYLMFLAGLEIDLIDFIENKVKSIFIGLASFFIPFVSGYLISRYVLEYEVMSSWLIGAMLSSHTLISYPILGKMGLVSKSIVTIVVGATIIADILALVAMELITNFAQSGFDIDGILLLALHFALFFFIVLLVVPRLARIFLNVYEGNLGVQYIFVLLALFISAATAHLLEIEPILGAFFSGLVLNRQIMNTSALYKRIEFIGTNLFIPFFLISIGMLANFNLYLNKPHELIYLTILVLTAFGSKYLAALVSKLIFKTSRSEMNLLFGLSTSRAASAIAIILIGLNMGLVTEAILNNTVILILITSISSSYITQYSGKKLLVDDNNFTSSTKKSTQKLLVPVANPANIENLLDFAALIKTDNQAVPIYPLTVFTNRDNNVRNQIDEKQKKIVRIIESMHSDIPFETNTRIDGNVTNGIVRAAEEIVATGIIMGWNNRHTPFHILFGNVLNNLLEKTNRMLLVIKTPTSLREVKRITLFCNENAQFEPGFTLWLDTLITLSRNLQLKFSVNCTSRMTYDAIQKYMTKQNTVKYLEHHSELVNLRRQQKSIIKNSAAELLVFVNARRETVSHSRQFEHIMNNSISRFSRNNIVIIYPEQ